MIKSILISLSDGVGNFSINFENYLSCSYRSLKETVKSYKPKAIDIYIAERLYKDKYLKDLSLGDAFKLFLGG